MSSLLLLTEPLSRVLYELPKVLEAAAKYSCRRLYVHWDCFPPEKVPRTHYQSCSKIISSIYQIASQINPGLDIRVVLNGFKLQKGTWETSLKIDNFLIDYKRLNYIRDINKKYEIVSDICAPVFLLESPLSHLDDSHNDCDNSEATDEVVIGGTFDHIHIGHKIFLSESVMRTKKRLTIGIADGPLLEKKVLKDLILPCDMRMKLLKDFLDDIDSSVEFNLVPITEPMGPTSWDNTLQLIVVSKETENAVDYINNHRKTKGMNLLQMYVVKLVQDQFHSKGKEMKYSSSSMRRRLLGTRLKCVKSNEKITPFPYIIGLTGGSASGKSNIASYLGSLGAGIIDCDALGHIAYTKGSLCYKKLVNIFGTGILLDCGEIDRKILGSIVFKDIDNLKLLNNIVWPQIEKMVKERIDSFRKLGTKIVVIDAAVLIEAKWTESCHEIWVSFVKREEAVKRIMVRDKKTQTQAEDRIARQMSNKDILNYANIAFCSEFAYEFTQSQVKKAWDLIMLENKFK